MGLTISIGTLSPAFTSNTTLYNVSVGYDVSSVTVTPTVPDPGAIIEVRVNSGVYKVVASGTPSESLSLNVGLNPIEILVTAQDEVSTKLYTVNVTRTPLLTDLTISHGTLSPSYSQDTLSYSASVENSVSSVTVTPTVSDPNATIQVRVNGGTYSNVTSGSPSGNLPLNVGANVIEVYITAQDGSTVTYTINVTRLDNTSLTVSGVTEVNEGTTINLTLNATGAGDNPVYSMSGGTAGATLVGNSFTWTTTESDDGSYEVTFTVNGSTSKTVTITVNEVNQAPVITAIPDTTIAENEPLSIDVIASDADRIGGVAQTLTYTFDGDGTNASFDTSTKKITWTPGETAAGTYTFVITVSDGITQINESFTVTVTAENQAPSLGTIADQTVQEHNTLSVDLSATDVDGDALTYTVAEGPGSIVEGTYEWTPGETDDGEHTVAIQVSDGSLIDTKRFTITVIEVNQAPVLGAIGNKTVKEGEALTFTASATDSDLVGGTANILTYSLAEGAPTGATINTSTGAFSWTPDGTAAGTYTFTIKVSDGTATDEEEITVTVTESNTAPTITTIGNKSVNELQTLTFTVAASDTEGDAFVYSLGPDAPAGATIEASTGAFHWTPTEAEDGTHTVTIIVRDNGTPEMQASETITITVNEVNQAPVLGAIGNKTVKEGEALTFTASATDSDLVGGTANILTYSLAEGAPTGATINTSTGAFSWTPDDTAAGTYTVTIRVSDGAGGSDEETITITVDESNTAPTITPIGNKSVEELDTLSFTVEASDAEGDTLTYSLGEGAPAGATIDPATGEFSWTPGIGAAGTYTLTIRVSDGFTTVEETITITVVGKENTAPSTQGQQLETDEDSTLQLTLIGNDLEDNLLTYTIITEPSHGQISGTGPNLTYTPNLNYNGQDSFTFKANDGSLDSNTSTVTITILPVNDDPEAQDASLRVELNTPVNGKLTASDVDHDALTYEIVEQPSKGTVTIVDSNTGTFTYTPHSNEQGVDAFTFKVNDGEGESNIATVTLSITANNAPIAVDGSIKTNQNQEVFGRLIASDIDEQILTYTIVQAPSQGIMTITNSRTGEFKYIPNQDEIGEDLFTFKVNDGLEDSQIATISIDIIQTESSIYGFVFSSTGGTVSGINVQLIDDLNTIISETQTDNEGQYLFNNLPAGTYTVVTPDQTKDLARGQVILEDGQNERLDLVLPEKGSLLLTVTPEQIIGDGKSTSILEATLLLLDGTPVSGVSVQFSTTAGSLGTTEALTNAEGKAVSILRAPVINSIQPRIEEVKIFVRDSRYDIYAEKVVLVTFLPASIEGVVTNGGVPVAGAIVSVAEDFDGDSIIDFTAEMVTGPDGKYNIYVPKGDWTYTIKIKAPVTIGNKTSFVETEQTSIIGSLSGRGETIAANHKISGKIFVVAQSNTGPQEVSDVFLQGENVVGEIRDQDGNLLNKEVSISADGTFKINDVNPGEYSVLFQVTAPNGEKLAGTKVKIVINQDGQLALQTPLIDPYGIVVDSLTKQPIENVFMQLFWADTELNKQLGRTPHTIVELPILPDFAPNQNRDPQYTTVFGEYAWMVFPDGDYYIVAEKEGYITYDSRDEGRNVPVLPGEDSYITNGIIHVGETIVEYSFEMIKITEDTNPPAPPGGGPIIISPPPIEEPVYEHHTRYIQGYSDGTFRPERAITRAEVATILARITSGKFIFEKVRGIYPDVSQEHWASGYIAEVTKKGLMQGYPDGNFRPNAPITRAEMAAIVVRFMKLSLLQGVGFEDTKGHWGASHIFTAKEAGYVFGFPDGSYLPEQSTSRAEFVTIMNRMIKRGPLTGIATPSWPDVSIKHWAFENVEEASKHHEYELLENGKEKFIKFLTEEELAKKEEDLNKKE